MQLYWAESNDDKRSVDDEPKPSRPDLNDTITVQYLSIANKHWNSPLFLARLPANYRFTITHRSQVKPAAGTLDQS